MIWASKNALLCMAIWLALPTTPARAEVVVYHSFTGGTADGKDPNGSLIQSGSNFIGMAEAGGSSDFGIIYRIGTGGSGYEVTHVFTGGSNDGRTPFGSLTPYLSSLYGLTYGGGNSDGGVAFKIDTDGTGFDVVHPFGNTPSDGRNPQGSLGQTGSTFFGATINGGNAGGGTVFKVNADGSGYTVMHTFAGGSGDGLSPTYGAPAISGNTLYGMTALGGSANGGVIYKINTDGSGFTILHSFTFAPTDGNTPFGSVIVNGTTIYGMTSIGGSSGNGTIFKMNTDGSGFALLHSFGARLPTVAGLSANFSWQARPSTARPTRVGRTTSERCSASTPTALITT